MGRPKKVIDEELVRDLASIGCTWKEIASVVGCAETLLMRRFASIIKDGHEHFKSSLRRLQYKAAQNGNVAMLIWLGKQVLGQRERVEHSADEDTADKVIKALKAMDATIGTDNGSSDDNNGDKK